MPAYNDPVGLVVTISVIQLVATTALALRFYSIYKKKTPFASSEWLILVAWITSLGLLGIEIYGIAVQALAYPLGGVLEDESKVTHRLIITKKLQLVFLLLGIFNTGLVKLSVSCFYYRIFNAPLYRLIISTWISIIFLWTLTFCLAGLLECGTHLTAIFYAVADYNKYCGSAEKIGWGMIGTDVATDLVTLVIPMPMIYNLHISNTKKILVAATLMIGFLSLGASIAKAYIYINATLGQYTEDAILTITGISIWNLLEVQIGIIAACGPTLRPILSDLLPIASVVSLVHTLRDKVGSRSGSEGSVNEQDGQDIKPQQDNEERFPVTAIAVAAKEGGDVEMQRWR